MWWKWGVVARKTKKKGKKSSRRRRNWAERAREHVYIHDLKFVVNSFVHRYRKNTVPLFFFLSLTSSWTFRATNRFSTARNDLLRAIAI